MLAISNMYDLFRVFCLAKKEHTNKSSSKLICIRWENIIHKNESEITSGPVNFVMKKVHNDENGLIILRKIMMTILGSELHIIFPFY